MNDQVTSEMQENLAISMLVLRITLGLFLLQWGIEKFLHPEFSAAINAVFYHGLFKGNTLWMIFGAVEIAVALFFFLGFQKRWSYLLGFLIHAVTTIVSLPRLLNPYHVIPAWNNYPGNHLFIAGVPVLAGFWLMYRNRTLDTLWALDARKIVRKLE